MTVDPKKGKMFGTAINDSRSNQYFDIHNLLERLSMTAYPKEASLTRFWRTHFKNHFNNIVTAS
jgi:hypothetical protein